MYVIVKSVWRSVEGTVPIPVNLYINNPKNNVQGLVQLGLAQITQLVVLLHFHNSIELSAPVVPSYYVM